MGSDAMLRERFRLDVSALQPRLRRATAPGHQGRGLAWWQPAGEPGHWLVVADADEAARRSPLYEPLP